MRAVHVAAAATVTALGETTDLLWTGLMEGRTAIKPVTRFATDRYCAGIAACIDGLPQNTEGTKLNHLLDRLFARFPEVPAETLLLTATTKGGIDQLESFARGQKDDLSELFPAALSAGICRRFGLRGGGININAACASSAIAVARGAAMIASGRTESVLVCCMDLVSEFVFSGFSALQGLAREPARPFDRDRNGLTLGEGGAALLLTSAECAARGGYETVGKICGWGAANDASHITAPARDGSGLILAVKQALHRAGLQAEEVAAICAHGTGTVYNDQMELTAFNALFPEKIPMFSIKGAIGHTLGAAGGTEVAISLRALASGCIPPTVGLLNPAEGGGGMVFPSSREINEGYLLTTNSGFGGVNAALVLQRGEK